MGRKFKKTPENFRCAVCGLLVQGDGFTNHCPECLWSMHCDINPGDRAQKCRGLMEPVGYLLKKGKKVLVQRCLKCGVERLNKVSKSDNLEALYPLGLVMPVSKGFRK